MQLGFYFDQSRCSNCLTCVVACKDWHDIPAGPVSWRRVVTLEEGNIINGFGTMIADCLYSQLGFQGRLRKLGIRDLHVPHATRGEQINAVGMDAAGIAREVITGLAE